MDMSDQYIKMCSCLEIQLQEFDYRPNFHFAYYLDEQWRIEHDFLGGEKLPIWVPRQDQVQEMLGTDNKEPFCTWLERLGKFTHLAQPWDIPIDKNGLKTIGWFESWEQLWLAFYMYEKHKLIWGGGKWVAG